jgi:hypothetical protein
MAWTDPAAQSDGSLINETIWNRDIVDNLAYLIARTEPDSLTNKSGAQLTAGAVVVADSANDNAFTTTTTEENPAVIGVVAETIDNEAAGRVATAGIVTVNVQGNVARGDYLGTSSTEGRAKSAGVAKGAGTFAIALTAYAGGGAGTVQALVLASFSGVSDHGALTGLADDDHSQYYNQARGDVRYSQLGHNHDHGALTGLADDDHTQYLLATGARAGASSQAQDFGSNGIKADVVAESTGAAGVTVDGVLLKDSDVYPLGSAQGLATRFERLFGAAAPTHATAWTVDTFLGDNPAGNQLGFETNGTVGADDYSPTSPFSKTNTGTVQMYVQNSILKFNSLSGVARLGWTSSTGKRFIEAILQWSTRAAASYGGEIRCWGVQSPGATDWYVAYRFVIDRVTYPTWPWRVQMWNGQGVADATYTTTAGTLMSDAQWDPTAPYKILIDTQNSAVSHNMSVSGMQAYVSVTPLFNTSLTAWTACKTMDLRLGTSFNIMGIQHLKLS